MINWDAMVYTKAPVKGDTVYSARLNIGASHVVTAEHAKWIDVPPEQFDAIVRHRMRRQITRLLYGELIESMRQIEHELCDLVMYVRHNTNPVARPQINADTTAGRLEDLITRLSDARESLEPPEPAGASFAPITPASPWSNVKGVGDKQS